MKLEVVTPAATPILTTAEAKSWLRIESGVTEDDTLIDSLVAVATDQARAFLNREIINASLRLWLTDFPDEVALPGGQVTAITAVKYLDTASVEQTLSSSVYETHLSGEWRPLLRLASGQQWPAIDTDSYYPVRIEYTAGYGAASTDVPDKIVQAIRQQVGHLYENREAVAVGQFVMVPQTWEALLWPERRGVI